MVAGDLARPGGAGGVTDGEPKAIGMLSHQPLNHCEEKMRRREGGRGRERKGEERREGRGGKECGKRRTNQ